MSIARAHPTVDFNARFGKPRIQRYKVSDSLRLSLEHRADGKASKIEIAPAGYRGYDPLQPLGMSSKPPDQILEELLPGITSNGLASNTVIRTTSPGFSREIRCLPGASLTRDYPLGEDRSKMIAAVLSITTSDLRKNLSGFISAFDPPEYEQFDAGAGLAVGVFYCSEASIRQILVSSNESLLDHSDYRRPIELDAAETLLRQLLPPSISTDKPQRSVFRSGALIRERELYGQIFVWRDYVNDDLIAAGVVWS